MGNNVAKNFQEAGDKIMDVTSYLGNNVFVFVPVLCTVTYLSGVFLKALGNILETKEGENNLN